MKDELTKGQELALKKIKSGKNVFITSKAGCGKSFLINKIKERYMDDTQFCSSTGVSAINIGGSTVHSFFNLGLMTEPKEQITYKILNSEKLRYKLAAIRAIKRLVIDEISMLSDLVLIYIDHITKIVRNSKKPFGGIQVILVGDFLQLPPVFSRQDEGYVLNSPIWASLKLDIILLTEVKRQNDTTFIEILDDIRNASISERTKKILLGRKAEKFQPDIYRDAVFVVTTNKAAEIINNQRMSELATPEFTFTSSESGSSYDLEFYKKNSLLRDKLVLKKGCQVMLIINLDLQSGLANGSLGVVKDFEPQNNYPIVVFANGEERIIDEYTFKYEKYCPVAKETQILCEIMQIPLIPAYSLTAHKLQGITLEKAVLDISESFADGQVYTAISRVKTLDGLFIKSINFSKIKAHKTVVEYYKLLENL